MSDLDLSQFEGHTPGPWKAMGRRGLVRGWFNVWAGNGILAMDLWEPDAALIAAAPTLLEELRAARTRIEKLEAVVEALPTLLSIWHGEHFCGPDCGMKPTHEFLGWPLVESRL